MWTTRLCLAAALVTALFAAGPVAAVAAEAPAAVPLPAWLKRGVRVTYLSGSASVPGETRILMPDPKGDWVGPDGRRLAVGEARGTGSMGYHEYTIVAADERTVAADLRMFLLLDPDPAGRCSPRGGSALVGTPDGLDAFWFHPAKLAALRDDNAGGFKVTRGQFPLNGKLYNTLTKEVRGDKGYTRLIYDLETGLQLVHSSSWLGQPTVLAGPDGIGRAGAPSTMVGTVTLSRVRPLDIPWAQDDFPAWADGRRLDYRGIYQTFVPGSPVFEQGMTVSAAFGKAGKGWVPVKITTQVAGLIGSPPIEVANDRAASPMSASPHWISPQTLRKLRAGQVIDDDPVTRFRTTVAAVEANAVVLVEQGPVDRTQAVYDPNTGTLSAITTDQDQGTGRTRVQLRLDAPR